MLLLLISYCFLSLLLPFGLFPSSPAQVLHMLQSLRGIPAPVWVTHGLQHLLTHSAPLQEPSSAPSPTMSPSTRLLPHLLLCPLSCILTFPPRETGTPLPGHFSIKLKLPLRITLQLAESLPSSYPGCCCLSAELPAFTRVTPAPCISTKCHFKESKTKEVCCVGSDHQVQLIRSFPHRLPTKVLQPRDPFHAETAEKVFSQPGWCSILPPCLSSPSPPNIQAASKAVDGHIPQHSFPKSESTSTN